MKFTDLFVRRPVLASVVSLLILLIGMRSLTLLEVRQYPETENTVVTVSTAYPGASSELINGFITTPLQQAIAEAEGIDYLVATSTQGHSIIEAHMVLNYDSNAAVAEIQAKVASQRNVLPEEAENPVIDSTTGDSTALMYMAFYSEAMSPAQITDYLLRVVRPKLQAVPGVSKAQLIGNKTFAMRIWLDPRRMAALGVTANDVREVLLENNYLASVGHTKGAYVAVDLSATTDISREEDFLNLVVREADGALVRLRDVAEPQLGAEDYDSSNWYNGKPAIFIGIEQAPGANPLDIAGHLHDLMPEIRRQLPSGVDGYIVYDASAYIEDAIREVFRTLAEAVLVVLVVIFLFLGSLRAALVPAIAVPLSLIGGAFLMLVLGFSLNLLTLLAMVLAIGLVVDDAIIVVENIHRHLEHGESRFQAAIHGARELGLPIIAMTTTLVAVYAPIGFMGGLVGTLFTEFAFTLASAVLVSGVVALTLSPMLSSKMLRPVSEAGRFEQWVERFFTRLAGYYLRLLRYALESLPVVIVFAGAILCSIYFMYVTSQNELAPTEDQSILFFQATAPQTATIDYDEAYSRQIIDIFESFPEYHESFLLLGQGGDPSTVFGGFKMPVPSQRERSQMEIQPEMQQKLQGIAGFQIAVFPRPSLPGSGGGLPLQFVITSAADFSRLDQIAEELIRQSMASGKFAFLQKSVKFSRPKTTLKINRDLAGDLGIRMKDIGQNLGIMLGGGYINWFNLEGRSYKVIPQVDRRYRLDQEMLENYYIRTGAGELIPLATLISFEETVEPSKRVQFQQLNSLTVQGVMAPGVAVGEALAYLEDKAREIFPSAFSWDYAGESRQYTQQGSALMVTFFFSLLVIYLVLAAQFESWRDPVIILMSVPMSIAGALVFLTLGFATVNIYTQVGLITLIGLIAKNGILIVEFANQLQLQEGLDKQAAVEKASSIRLRPILMTTVSMIVAMVPLLMASGPGAVSRFDIGLVVASGLGIGTLFTLFVVPAVYLLVAGDHREEKEAVQEPMEQESGFKA
ncbi:Acriflavin resistance protein [Nitrosococcus oceani ATCC 19707]|uniref:Acriflavin resistance protein n=2 Tax=Nitrosococcus oceani TaxID=1229 RepID=Q3JEL4_NITOC|nr:efflux RND transporter permease subunit [Nitrosococcus oceani]ABA56732.1 Acriflavin resistance protein [Nitrosococcus oceani ATCC 19707]EDZ65611.1 RND transporter, HAE1/HME family, permease protein [Nitrosococcus oceani AFC27]KFI20806.1 acriflavine resistance protein B [Nitrosococcus oceani C-27]GEM20488.1 acriflavine resistance protein B [Nitrosococcus oceani]